MNFKIRITDQDGNVLYTSKESYIDINKKVPTKTHNDVHDFGIVIKRGDKVISNNNRPQKVNDKQSRRNNNNKDFKKNNNKQKSESLFDRMNKEKNVKHTSQIKEEHQVNTVEINQPVERPEVVFNNKKLNKSVNPSKLTEKDILDFLNNTKEQMKTSKKEEIKKEEVKDEKENDIKADVVHDEKHQKTLADKRNKYMMLYKSKEKILKQQKEDKDKYDEYSEYDNAPKYEKIVNNRKGGEF